MKRRGIIIIAVVAALLIGGTVYAVVKSNGSDEAAPTASGGNNAADAPARDTGNRAQPQPAPSQAANPGTPSELANTGPGDIFIYVLIAALAAGVGHFVWQRRRT